MEQAELARGGDGAHRPGCKARLEVRHAAHDERQVVAEEMQGEVLGRGRRGRCCGCLGGIAILRSILAGGGRHAHVGHRCAVCSRGFAAVVTKPAVVVVVVAATAAPSAVEKRRLALRVWSVCVCVFLSTAAALCTAPLNALIGLLSPTRPLQPP